jgi:hypothetical protein
MSQIPSHTHSLSQSANNQREATTIPTATQQYEADDIKLLQHTKTDKYSEYYTYWTYGEKLGKFRHEVLPMSPTTRSKNRTRTCNDFDAVWRELAKVNTGFSTARPVRNVLAVLMETSKDDNNDGEYQYRMWYGAWVASESTEMRRPYDPQGRLVSITSVSNIHDEIVGQSTFNAFDICPMWKQRIAHKKGRMVKRFKGARTNKDTADNRMDAESGFEPTQGTSVRQSRVFVDEDDFCAFNSFFGCAHALMNKFQPPRELVHLGLSTEIIAQAIKDDITQRFDDFAYDQNKANNNAKWDGVEYLADAGFYQISLFINTDSNVSKELRRFGLKKPTISQPIDSIKTNAELIQYVKNNRGTYAINIKLNNGDDSHCVFVDGDYIKCNMISKTQNGKRLDKHRSEYDGNVSGSNDCFAVGGNIEIAMHDNQMLWSPM